MTHALRRVAPLVIAMLCLPSVALARSSSSSSSSKGGKSGHVPQDPDFGNWEKPVEGHSGFGDAEGESSSGVLDLGRRQVQELEQGETRLLAFDLDSARRCSVEVKGSGVKPQLAFLDQSTRVAALGHTASLTPGSYFVRIKARQAGRYSVRLLCPTTRTRRHSST